MLTPASLLPILPATLLSGPEDCALTGEVNTDSRVEKPGSLFFALSGERFDGNDFAAQAARNGAAAVVVSRPVEGVPPHCAVLLTDDTLAALQALARWRRSLLPTLKVVGITGSNGKTSTKDFTRSVLSRKYRTVATRGNLNNHIGVPLSILAAPADTEAAVWEMGMNHPGELAPLCGMVQPEIGIITCIGTAHIEFMKSRQAIAEEKATVARCLPAHGFLLYPAQDDFASYLAESTRANLLPVGGPGSPVRAENILPTEKGSAFTLIVEGLGSIAASIDIPGRHMVGNALLAAAAGKCLGLSLEEIAQGLSESSLTKGRLRRFTHSGHTILDDTYNANPDSMRAALDTLAATPLPAGARRIAVLGKMGELGEFTETGHRQTGAHAAQKNIDIVVAAGDPAQYIKEAAEGSSKTHALFFPDKEQAEQWLRENLLPGDVLLFKGSRSAAMETLMNQLFPPQS